MKKLYCENSFKQFDCEWLGQEETLEVTVKGIVMQVKGIKRCLSTEKCLHQLLASQFKHVQINEKS